MLTIKLIVAVSDFQTVFHKAGRQRSPKLPGRLLNMLVLDINSGDSDSASLGWRPHFENHPPGRGLDSGSFINPSLCSTTIEVFLKSLKTAFLKNAVFTPP